MKKSLLTLGCCLCSAIAFAGGVELEFFGYKVCNVGFDVNPFSRDDGRPSRVCVPAYAPQYYTLPSAPAVTGAAASASSRQEERSIVVKDSSNVTIVNHENQQSSRPVYAPAVRTVCPAVQYYTYPVSYAYPAYYPYSGYYYHRPCYHYPYHRWWW